MDFLRPIKKIFWKLSAKSAEKQYSLNESLIYFGVTGTDGKTTTSSFLYEIAKAHGYNPLMITTVGARFQDKEIELDIKSNSFAAYSLKTAFSSLKKLNFAKFSKNIIFSDYSGYSKDSEQHRTTPLASEIRKTIIDFEKQGADFFIIEATSHSLDQYRVEGIKFDSVIITNITSEHLDYHGNWENYANAKARLITMLKDGGTLAINKSDERSYEFLKKFIKNLDKKINLIEYSVPHLEKINDGEFSIEVSKEKSITNVIATQLTIDSKIKSKLQLFGNYNVFNALAAFSGFYGFNNSNVAQITQGISNLKDVKGRMNFLRKDPDVIVDFAHTPNAMRRALESLRHDKEVIGKVWVVFGCAGLRDKYKRPEMGKIVFELADNILITAEDPRTENLHDINNQIISGFKDSNDDFIINSFYQGFEYKRNENKFVMRFDEPNLNSRKFAIRFAITNAEKDDIVIILGKGHERSIAFGETEYEWNDINFVQAILVEQTRPSMKITSE